MSRKVLVTGGAGYIGSITCVQLLAAGWQPVVFDNFSNSQPRVLDHIAALTGVQVPLVQADVRDAAALATVFSQHDIHAVVHLAGLKAVGESVRQPLAYQDTNVTGTQRLAQAMAAAGVKRLVFSSSATVYGEPEGLPLVEGMRCAPQNPYGRTKWHCEQLLADVCAADADWAVTCLRYFNPVGAHPSGELGEDPRGVPNNLMPFMAQVAVGRQPLLRVFGNDYLTPDGTGVRDYLHVMDLADGHVAAVTALDAQKGFEVFNLGTGTGVSVLQLKASFEQACGQTLPTVFADRRPGDVAANWADPSRARNALGWQARRSLQDMCDDTWRWQSRYPQGFDTAHPDSSETA
ncbi:UDP-glucose 4-epimerase GalE [Ideonella margarita]|uniref:UDP-glucose 4-epimerase n=1 Tax=Ideonella margarita TaxID=2984191 RepID=A0ABU9C6F2_9BURK